jgi:hypothetical protein
MKNTFDGFPEIPFGELLSENLFFKIIVISKRGKIFPLVGIAQMIYNEYVGDTFKIQCGHNSTAYKSGTSGYDIHNELLSVDLK